MACQALLFALESSTMDDNYVIAFNSAAKSLKLWYRSPVSSASTSSRQLLTLSALSALLQMVWAVCLGASLAC